MKIKVCGMRDAENIRQAEALGVDLMGFIFWPKSSRYVSELPAYLPSQCQRVGVFVNTSVNDICRHIEDYRLDVVQLHGSESPEFTRQVKSASVSLSCRKAAGGGVTIIKAFNIATPADLALTTAYEGVADLFLFDTKGQSVGGNGEKFDWTVLSHYSGSTPFLLSGGIGPGDAARIKSFRHPKCIGIDLNSRFEQSPGMKDIHQLKTFIESL